MLLLQQPEKQKIVATILAKDEADFLATTIEHHINQGVSAFIVTDNSSTDNTKEIASKYKEVVEIIDEPDDTHNQALSVTRMAVKACELNPDWIIHLDADELWCGLETLGFIEDSVVYSTKSYIHPPVTCGPQDWYLNLDGIEEIPGRGRDTKVAHRPDPNIEILHGNHGVKNAVPYHTNSIFRHHYPVRSYSQFEKKVINGYKAMARRGSSCDRWDRWYAQFLSGELQQIYDLLTINWKMMIQGGNCLKYLPVLLDFWCDPTLAKEIMGRAIQQPDHNFVDRFS